MRNRTSSLAYVTALIVSLGWSTQASANLVGDQVFFDACGPSAGICFDNLAATFFVTDDATDTIFVPVGSLNINGNSISITLTSTPGPGAFNGFVFSDLQWVDVPTGTITGLTFLSNTIPNFDASDLFFFNVPNLGFGPSSVLLNVASTGIGTAVIQIETSHVVIPVPPSLLLLASALFAIRVFRNEAA